MKKNLLITTLFLIAPFLLTAQESQIDQSDTITAWPSRPSIIEITNSISELKREAVMLEDEISSEIEKIRADYQNKIVNETDIQLFELNRLISNSKTELDEALREALLDLDPTNADIISELNQTVANFLQEMQQDLEGFSGVDFDMESARVELDSKISNFAEKVAELQNIIEQADGQLLNQDADEDGLSDYDETYIYNTDPNNINTAGGTLNDYEKVIQQLDPTSAEETPIEFENPKEISEQDFAERVHITDTYTVTSIELDPENDNKLKMTGRALPNSIITLYVFSTPIIVKVKTDGRGEWTYTFDQELENGEHEVHVATVNNSGKIIAKSNPIPFVKTAEAAAIGTFSVGNVTEGVEGNFVQRNLNLIIIALLLIGLIITISLFGKGPKTAVPPEQLK